MNEMELFHELFVRSRKMCIKYYIISCIGEQGHVSCLNNQQRILCVLEIETSVCMVLIVEHFDLHTIFFTLHD